MKENDKFKIFENMKMHSKDWVDANIDKIAQIFPNCITETRDKNDNLRLAVDYDLLKQEISDNLVEGQEERYHLNWPGKRQSLLNANAPIAKTLRPVRKESINFDNTQNLFIEGDNLDALKLLQESYLSKIKMIYIDPPYNTGNDFIYKDNFVENTESFLERSNQKDEYGNRLISNTDSKGRFHSDWLSMMYPRLKLAKNLLRDDGVIFISMGDFEIGTLRLICDEIFGIENFEGHIHWRRRHNQPNDPTKMIGIVAEHILSYSKDKTSFKQSGVGKLDLTGTFSNPDNDPRGPWSSKPWKVGSDQSGSRYVIKTPSGKELNEEWMGDEGTYNELLKNNKIIFPNNGKGSPRKKYYQSEREEEGQSATNWWPHDQFGHNQEGNSQLTEIFDGKKNVFSNPKPPKLIKNLISLANCKDDDIVLDFFLGSASTYHACCLHNSKLKFIGVQLPEELNENISEHKPAIEVCKELKLEINIASLSKERMKRVDAELNESNNGFRVLKIDSSNKKNTYTNPNNLEQSDLLSSIDTFKNDRSKDDILFQVLLELGIDLMSSIKQEKINEKIIYFVNNNELIACFENQLNEDQVTSLASFKPKNIIFLDRGFDSDDIKLNITQIFKQISADTIIKVI